MRPASEIHSALELLSADHENQAAKAAADKTDTKAAVAALYLSIARDVLAWAAGERGSEIANGNNPWLAGYLLDDPPQVDDSPVESN